MLENDDGTRAVVAKRPEDGRHALVTASSDGMVGGVQVVRNTPSRNKRWLNLYSNTLFVHPTQESADLEAGKSLIACVVIEWDDAGEVRLLKPGEN